MVKVPVINNNLKESEDQEVQRITHRFYLVDTLGGIDGSYPSAPSYIKYAKNISLNLTVNTDSDEKLNLPFLTITYEHIKITSDEISGTVNYNVI